MYDVLTADSGEGFSLFTISWIGHEGSFRTAILGCSLLVAIHTELELSECFTKIMSRFTLEKNIPFHHDRWHEHRKMSGLVNFRRENIIIGMTDDPEKCKDTD